MYQRCLLRILLSSIIRCERENGARYASLHIRNLLHREPRDAASRSATSRPAPNNLLLARYSRAATFPFLPGHLSAHDHCSMVVDVPCGFPPAEPWTERCATYRERLRRSLCIAADYTCDTSAAFLPHKSIPENCEMKFPLFWHAKRKSEDLCHEKGRG